MNCWRGVFKIADRTVSVKLKADVDAYNRGVLEAKTTTEGLQRSVVVLERDVKELTPETVKASKATGMLGVEAGKAKTQTKGLGEELGKTKTQTTGLGGETDKTKEKTRGFGEESDKTKAKVVALAEEYHKTRTALAAMGDEFRRTGSIDMDRFKSLSTSMRDLERVGASLSKGVSDGMKDGADRGLKNVGSVAASNPYIAAGIAAAIVVGAPAIGAAVGAAVVLGVGGGVLVAGIVAAAQDPRVKSAWGKLGDDVKHELVGAGAVFAPSLVRAADTFGDRFSSDIMPHVRADFVKLEPLVDKLVDGAAGFAANMMPGVDELVDTAGPFIEKLADELPNLGNAVSDFFESVSAGGPGALQFFGDLLVFTEKTIVAVGNVVEFLSKGYALVSGIGSIMTGDMTGALRIVDQFGDKPKLAGAAIDTFNTAMSQVPGAATQAGLGVKLAADHFGTLSSAISATATTSDMLAGQMVGKLFSSMMSLDQATLGFARSQTQVSEAIKDNGRSLDIHTAKGQANIGVILGAVQANMAQYQANIAVGMSAVDAAKAYDTNTAALEAQLRKAGFTKEAIDGLIGKYRDVPGKVNTDIAMKGLTDAINSLDDAIRLANHLDGRKINTYTVHHITTEETVRRIDNGGLLPGGYRVRAHGGIDSYAHGGVQSFARAGIYEASGPGLVKFAERETGGEAYIPRLGISQDRAMGLASKVGDWHGFDVVPRQAPGYAAFANTRPMAPVGASAAAGPSAEAIARALARELAPMIDAVGDRPAVFNIDSQRIAQAVKQGDRGLVRRG